jgi:hypothetical protein
MIIHRNIEQNTEAWHKLRHGKLTASDFKSLITEKTQKITSDTKIKDLAYKKAVETIFNYKEWEEANEEVIFNSFDIERGNRLEPIARQEYEARTLIPVEEVGFIESECGLLGYSPDGLVGEDGLIEIKAPRKSKHLETIFKNKVPLEHIAQIQGGLYLSGRKWLDFISYNENCNNLKLSKGLVNNMEDYNHLKDKIKIDNTCIIRVYRDEEYIAKLQEAFVKYKSYLDIELKNIKKALT